MTRTGRHSRSTASHRWALLAFSALLAMASMGTVLQAYAMPVEARTTETWFDYQSSVGFDFTAAVKKGKFYADPLVTPDELERIRLPVDPPVYHRVLITRLTDAIQVRVPYQYKADRDAATRAFLRVDGTMRLPNFWQEPYPLLAEKELPVTGNSVSGVETLTIPVSQLVADMEETKTLLGVMVEPLEVTIRPHLEVVVDGLRQPLKVVSEPEFKIAIRTSTIEVDEPREVRSDKTLSDTQVVPTTVALLGREFRVGTLRQVSLISLGIFLALAAASMLLRWRPAGTRDALSMLGAHLIRVRAFELPGGTAVAEVQSARELVQLHAQTERPVLQVGDTYYLLDGTTCYRLQASGKE